MEHWWAMFLAIWVGVNLCNIGIVRAWPGRKRYTRDEIISAYLKACLSTTASESQKRWAAFMEALDGK